MEFENWWDQLRDTVRGGISLDDGDVTGTIQFGEPRTAGLSWPWITAGLVVLLYFALRTRRG